MRKNIWARAANAAAVAMMALALAWATPASAQTPSSATLTPAGDTIKNIATVTYKDSNNNNYSAADTVAVVVGTLAAIDVRRWADSVLVASPSTNDTVTFTIHNLSNASTLINFALIDSTQVVASAISYVYNGTEYPSLAALTTGIGSVAQNDSVVVRVVYDVASGLGGLYDWLGLTATTAASTTGGSAASDSDQTRVITTLTGTVAVTPDAEPVTKIPGTQYVAQFTVTNNESGTDTFSLVDSTSTLNTAGLTIQNMYYCDDSGKTPITSVTLAAGANRLICVEYSVANNGPGTSGTIYLTATSTTTGTVFDTGSYVVTVIGPSISISKEAFVDASGSMGSALGSALVLPGQYLWYKMTVTNGSTTTPASSIEITDNLPTQVTWISTLYDTPSGSDPVWTGTGTTPTIIKAQLASLAVSTSRWVAIRVQVK